METCIVADLLPGISGMICSEGASVRSTVDVMWWWTFCTAASYLGGNKVLTDMTYSAK